MEKEKKPVDTVRHSRVVTLLLLDILAVNAMVLAALLLRSVNICWLR